MIEPNRLSVPGELAAHGRVEALFERIDRLGPDEVAAVSLPLRDPERRQVLLARLEDAADARGLGSLLDEARATVRDALLARLVAELPAGTYPTRSTIGGRPEDRASAVMAIEDAVAVAVAEDLLDPGDAAELADPGRRLLGMEPLAASLRSPGDTPERPEAPAPPGWEPSARDWVEAAHPAGGAQPLPGVVGLWRAFVGITAAGGVVAALAWGWADGQPLLGLLVAAAVVAVAWTLATFRRAR